jgi:hypothetical protein
MSEKQSNPLAILISFAISTITTALLYQQFNLPGWETTAALGGAVLYVAVTFIIGKIFKVNIVGAMLFSAILTGLIMLFVYAVFGAFLLIFGSTGLLLAYALEQENSD